MTAARASCEVIVTPSAIVVGFARPTSPTAARRMSIATMAITPTTEPHMPSKSAAKN